jgi:hypothetical protein
MKFHVGDKVRFLNEQGGGVVSKIINSNLVHVAIEEGFDIPVLPGELVLVDQGSHSDTGLYDRRPDIPEREKPEVPEKPIQEASQRMTKLMYGKNAVAKGIYLAFSPHDQKFLVSGGINLYLINNTPYDLIYSLILQDGENYTGKDFDTVFAFHRILIDSLSRDEISDFLNGYVQCLLYQDRMESLYMPVHVPYKVQSSRFFKENAYTSSPLTGEKAIMINLVEMSGIEKVVDAEGIRKLQSRFGFKPEKRKPVQPQTLIDKHKTGNETAEVDLHISALLENFSDMSNAEILNYQLSYLDRTLESALTHQYEKVTYIHGIGNGTLKNMIRKRIKETYPDFIIRNAPFSQYGNGAVEVLLNDE